MGNEKCQGCISSLCHFLLFRTSIKLISPLQTSYQLSWASHRPFTASFPSVSQVTKPGEATVISGKQCMLSAGQCWGWTTRLTPCRSFLLNSCMFGFSESLNFQHRVWSREERGCVAPGTCAQCRGPKGCKDWGCVSAWMHRGKQGVCFQLAYKCLQMESAVVLAPFQCLPGRTLPWAVPLCEQVRVLQQGLRCSCTHRWPQYLAASVSFLLVRGVTDTAQGTAGKQCSVGKA